MLFLKNSRSIHIVLITLSWLSVITTPVQANRPQATLYEKIAQENLKAVIDEKKESSTSALGSLINNEKAFYQLLEESLDQSLNLLNTTKRSIIFSLFSNYEKTYRSFRSHNSAVLDETSWKDLEILCGPKTSPELCIATKIDRASTESGRAVLYKKIIQPLSSSEEIRAQQHTTKTLLKHEDFFNAVDKKLTELAKTEDAVLSFFGEDLFHSIVMQNKFTVIGQERVDALKAFAGWINKNEVMLGINDLTGFALHIWHDLEMAIGAPLLLGYGLIQLMGVNPPQFLAQCITDIEARQLSKFVLFGSMLRGVQWIYQSTATKGLVNIGDGAMGLQRVYWSRDNAKTNLIFKNGLQEKLIHVATYMNNMKQVIKEASRHKELAHLPMIQNLQEAFKQLSQDADMRHLFDLLSTNTFRGKASFFSHGGRVLSAYKLMHELKHKLTPLIAAVGELDAQMSIARLYKEFENQSITFCFPTCIDEQTTPAIAAINFWNPIIDSDCVIPNTLYLGDYYNRCRNIAVSGPNAGGKTTITVRGLPICIILAQALGIAPAESLEFTPFGTIITYLNIPDDLAQGNSKFTAGVERALEILDNAQNNYNGFVLAAVDEALDGATYAESQAAAYALFEAIGKCDQTICLTTTHLPLVSELEKTGMFTNYKVSVTFDEAGRICYPYKLELGKADQNVVFKVLNEKGFAKDFVERSAEMLAFLQQSVLH